MATEAVSDTRIFADEVAPDLIEKNPGQWQRAVADEAAGNRLLFMSADGAQFDIINKSLWTRAGSLWFSNQYSCDIPGQRKGKTSWLDTSKGYLQKSARPAPSGPTLTWTPTGYEADDDAESGWAYSDDDGERGEDGEPRDAWQEEYRRRLDEGYTYDEAEELASNAVYGEPSPRTVPAVRSGFDWHDSRTWEKYPIPGREVAQRIASKHDLEVEPDGVVRPSKIYV
jgi:hypothetical protein